LGPSSLLLKDNAGLVGRLFKACYPNDTSSAISRRILAAIISERVDDERDVLRASNAHLFKKGQIYKELAIKSILRTLWGELTELTQNKGRLGRANRAGKRLRELNPGLYVGFQDLGLIKM
jgi:hypothetical protein